MIENSVENFISIVDCTEPVFTEHVELELQYNIFNIKPSSQNYRSSKEVINQVHS